MIGKLIKYIFWLIVIVGALYGFLVYESQDLHEVDFGISFSAEYAESLGLDPQVVYAEMLEELQPKHIRLAAMWKEVEIVKNQHRFESIDWYMDKAAEANAKVVLVVGQKAPRWPECHVPEWLDYNDEATREHLLEYVRATVNHYKDHPALHMWQVENEAFIHFTFGECDAFMGDAIYEEIDLVRSLDPDHDILVTDSGELGLWTKASKAGDYFGTTLYRVVRTPNGNIFTYDWLPAAFYTYKANILGIPQDRFFVAELQGEPWFDSGDPQNTPIDTQEETMNPERLAKHINYTKRIGVSRAYLWGVEWWYFMKQEHNDARYWEMVREEIVVE